MPGESLNELDMLKIAETYIHFKIEPTDIFIEESKAYLFYRSQSIANEIFHYDINVYVRVESGSYKAWVTVVGAIFIGISQYGSFRSGIDHIVNDARTFSEHVISDFINESGVKEERIFRLERRLGVSGKIQRVLKRIDQLESSLTISQTIKNGDGKTQRAKMKGGIVILQNTIISQNIGIDQNELEKIKIEIIHIFELLENDRDRRLFFESLSDFFKDELSEDFKGSLFSIPKEVVYRREDEIFPVPSKVDKLPPPE